MSTQATRMSGLDTGTNWVLVKMYAIYWLRGPNEVLFTVGPAIEDIFVVGEVCILIFIG